MVAQDRAGPTVRPDPDPTVLTTQALLREILNLKEIFETRIAGMDKAIVLLQTTSDRVPSWVEKAVGQLRELHDEKFSSIQTQFAERDTRTEQTSRDSKVAVDAALQAAKEAVGEQNKSNALAIAKSEAAFTKQIDQIGLLIQTTAKATDDKIDDIKTRLTTIEGIKQGGQNLWGYIVGGVGAAVGVFGLIALIWSMSHSGAVP